MENEKKIGCLQGCLMSVGIFISAVFGILTLLVLSIRGCGQEYAKLDLNSSGSKNRPVDECGHLYSEQWSAGADGDDAAKVVHIKLHGVITRETGRTIFGGEFDATSAIAACDRIRAAKADKDVRAIIIEINSPGGEVTLSDLVWHELQEFKSSETNRTVFAQLMDMACSGGYYIAAAADYIHALPTTITGSIGVIIPAINAAELAEKIGVKPVTVASSKNKDLLNPLVPTNPEHIKIVKKTVDQTYERFVNIVARSRKLSTSRVKEIADGRILTAQDALACKLVDGIGYQNDLLKCVEKKLGCKVRVVKYVTDFSFENFLFDGLMIKFTENIKHLILSEINQPTKLQYR